MAASVIARLSLLALLALGLAPGTWMRTPVVQGLDLPIALSRVDEPGEAPPDGWALEGVWEYKGDGLLFGGYSALLALDGNRLEAFSDRGGRFTFLEPDKSPEGAHSAKRSIAEQPVEPRFQIELFDIEAATRDPATGRYWLAFESTHAFQRYSAGHEGQGVRLIDQEVEWPGNAGAEAMVRLRDGRFLVINESGEEALLYPGDPLDGAMAQPIPFTPPPGDFSVTDVAELPDGRLMLLLRRVVRAVPPFEARIAIADWPGEADAPVLAPQIVLDLSAVAPPDNYEGLALRKRADGAVDVWVISDDNLSVMQRTLVVKLLFDPSFADPIDQAPNKADGVRPKQKARR